jgi:hypothetical protein
VKLLQNPENTQPGPSGTLFAPKPPEKIFQEVFIMLFAKVQDFMLTMATIIFLMGLITLGVGIIIVSSQAIGKNVKIIANQTVKLAQKGISEDVAGLVGNASNLLNALNQLVRSTTGIGIFLVITSLILFAATYGLLTQIH